MAITDLNGDGIPDLVTANDTLGGCLVSVLLGNGDGTFQGAMSYVASTVTYDFGFVAVADFNGDGIPDIAVANNRDRTVGVLLGNGDGTFQSIVKFGGFAAPTHIAAADFNEDGHPDLVVTDGGGIRVLMGNGDGTFQSPQFYPVTWPGEDWVAVADLNGDGHLDLVVSNRGNSSPPDVDGRLSVFLGNGDGTFQPALDEHIPDVRPGSVAVGDFNGDGIPDLVTTNNNYGPGGAIDVLLGNGDGTFQVSARYQTDALGPLTVADFNGDGNLDLAVLDFGSPPDYNPGISVLLGNGDGTFQPPTLYLLGGQNLGLNDLAAGDLNGDGYPDLAVATANSSLMKSAAVLINAADWGGPAPAPTQPSRLLASALDGPRDIHPVFAAPTAWQNQTPLPSIPVAAGGPAAFTQQIVPAILIGQTSQSEPASPSGAVLMACPAHDAVFGGWPDPLLDVLATSNSLSRAFLLS
jgi:hypothetical protein